MPTKFWVKLALINIGSCLVLAAWSGLAWALKLGGAQRVFAQQASTSTATATVILTFTPTSAASSSPAVAGSATATLTQSPTPGMTTDAVPSLTPTPTFPFFPSHTPTLLFIETQEEGSTPTIEVVLTPTWLPLPTVTFLQPEPKGSGPLQSIQHANGSPDLPKGSNRGWCKAIIRLWPLLLLGGIWLFLAAWFAVSQRSLK